jgi:hypothetical protein
MTNTSLELEVATRNKLNRTAIECHAAFREALKDFIGKKVIKQTPYKTWTAVVKKRLDQVESDLRLTERGFRITFDTSAIYNVWFSLDTTFNAYDYNSRSYRRCIKRDVAICRLDGDILEDVTDETVRPATDYTVEQVQACMKRYIALGEEMRQIESEMFEFRGLHPFRR